MNRSSNTKMILFHGDASTYEAFNRFVVDFQQNLQTKQEKIKNVRGSTNS
jgi:hypothetical protein